MSALARTDIAVVVVIPARPALLFDKASSLLAMGKIYEGSAVVEEFRSPQAAETATALIHQVWRNPSAEEAAAAEEEKMDWGSVSGLEEQQRMSLTRLSTRGVYWKHPSEPVSALFFLFHGGDVEADGNCLFTASQKAMRLNTNPRDLRRRTVQRFIENYEAAGSSKQEEFDRAIRNLYCPDLEVGWGVHVVQEVKLLASKADRQALDGLIDDLVQVGMQREMAAESIYKERCFPVDSGVNWAKYMSVSGTLEDEYDIITLQYTQEGLLTVDENRGGHAAAFGDDIAIESLATEFKREIFVVQAHGADAMIEDDNCVFFLPHHPRGEISYYPVFLFMKGTGWCGAGADHYEPLIAYPAPVVSQDKAAVVL